MKIGIYTYGTKGDVQPYISLGLALKLNGHEVTIGAPENFKELITIHELKFTPLCGNAEELMNSPEGIQVLKSENSIQLMKYFFKAITSFKDQLFNNYYNSILKVDVVIANSATIPFVYPICEKLNKKIALTYFMPPMAETKKFPVSGLDFFNFPLFNKWSYRIVHFFYWKIVKNICNETYCKLGLLPIKENILKRINHKNTLDLYCISKYLIEQPSDWKTNHKITGFLDLSQLNNSNPISFEYNPEVKNWVLNGEKPIYIGFGSNGIGNTEKIGKIIDQLLNEKQQRILLCEGWTKYQNLPNHPNLFVTKYIQHDEILPLCKLAIFHGGAGTLASVIRAKIPMIIISLYTDQPTWGKIIKKKEIGLHIPFKKLSTKLLLKSIQKIETNPIFSNNINTLAAQIQNENGLKNTITLLESYFTKEIVN